MFEHQDQKILVQNIKIIGIYVDIASQVCQKFRSDYYLDHKKNKSILMFSINHSNCFTETYLKPSQDLR